MVFLKDTHFAYSVAYMRTLENKMLDQADIDAILNMSGIAEAMKLPVAGIARGDKAGRQGKDDVGRDVEVVAGMDLSIYARCAEGST